MEAIAKARHLRYSAQKLRLVADLIRGKSVDESLAILTVMGNRKKGAPLVQSVLKTAVANFQNTDEGASVAVSALKVKSITVDAGPQIKRIRARAQGRAFRIQKNLSHITLVLAD